MDQKQLKVLTPDIFIHKLLSPILHVVVGFIDQTAYADFIAIYLNHLCTVKEHMDTGLFYIIPDTGLPVGVIHQLVVSHHIVDISDLHQLPAQIQDHMVIVIVLHVHIPRDRNDIRRQGVHPFNKIPVLFPEFLQVQV